MECWPKQKRGIHLPPLPSRPGTVSPSIRLRISNDEK